MCSVVVESMPGEHSNYFVSCLQTRRLTRLDFQHEITCMRTVKALLLILLLALPPIRLLADGTVSPSNPVGEKLYYEFLFAHFYSQLLPLVILGCACLIICVWLAFQCRARNLSEEQAGSYEI